MRNFLLIGILATVTLMSSCSKDDLQQQQAQKEIIKQQSIPVNGEYHVENLSDKKMYILGEGLGMLYGSDYYNPQIKDRIIISEGSTKETKKVKIALCYSCPTYGGYVDLGDVTITEDGSLKSIQTQPAGTVPYSNGSILKYWDVSIKKVSETQVSLAIKIDVKGAGERHEFSNFSGTASIR